MAGPVAPITQHRRDLVAVVIQLANRAAGGAFSVVSVDERPFWTEIEFDSPYWLRNFPESKDEPIMGTHRFKVTITPVTEVAPDV